MGKKMYLTTVPLGSNIKLSPPAANFPIQCQGFSMEIHRLAFPISELLASTATPEDEITVIAVRQTNKDPSADCNYALLKKELELVHPNCTVRSICISEDQNTETLLALFKQLLEAFPDEPATCYADITFGTKMMSIILFQALSCVHQLSNGVDIDRIIYREVLRHWAPELNHSVDDAWNYYDITSIFHCSSIAALAAGSNGRSFLLSLLNA